MINEWKNVLINQFHDVLPGTSINNVYVDANRLYRQVCQQLLINNNTLRSFVDDKHNNGIIKYNLYFSLCLDHTVKYIVNSLSWTRTIDIDGQFYEIAPSSIQIFDKTTPIIINDQVVVNLTNNDQTAIIENRHVRIEIDHIGRIKSFKLLNDHFDYVSANEYFNQLIIYDDIPLYWDAWDCMSYHLETGRPIETTSTEHNKLLILNNNGLIGQISTETFKISEMSSAKMIITLKADSPILYITLDVNWNENHKFLKVDFCTNINSIEAYYDCQFGYIRRPNHRNTSWDAAK
jgi:alpha-mannosidase